ncbi:MAG: histidine kinase [Alphaproteobacteria bacterium]|nr:histidine kinase [Alphaproteobacteria bacterium]MDE2111856.1 histidine kinase [Alphaproteobacteria bacterium]MDE2493596.1 histidine kinase [Alphaproteobacteria bacterium]
MHAGQQAEETAIDAERLFEGFEELETFRVQNILLVSSLYDSFILREDGRLNELLIGESLELNIRHVPGVTHVSSGAEALALVRSQPRFNLIVTNLHLGDMDAAALAGAVKNAGLDVPVVVLAYDYREVKSFVARHPATDIDRIFLWQGTPRILIAIVKYVEDKRNVLHDTETMGVPVILVVEDNIRYYSSFLPVIYTELITQSRRVISEGINMAHKLLRFRARPKLLLCSDYEEAAQQAEKYQDYLLGIVSDVEFLRGGELRPNAGFELAQMVRQLVPDVPIVLQSSHAQHRAYANTEGYSFLRKGSPTLLEDLRRILTEQFSLGDFVFRLPDGTEVARAGDMNALVALLHDVPAASLAYHAERNHFSHWLMARTEAALAEKLRPRKVSDYASLEELRRNILDSISEYRCEQNEVLIGDFARTTFKSSDAFFLRLGGGSLGGKARGLAFVRHLLHKQKVARSFPGVRIAVPPSLVLATDLFDDFLRENNLLDFALNSTDETEIKNRFLAASLPGTLRDDLRKFLEEVRYPLAVRSSSLLEDSQYQPFTGVYDTFMLANQGTNLDLRTEQLMEAIKRVYASTFSQHAKQYVRATPYRLEEEKMAVIVQQMVGGKHGPRFYPDFSGVVRSHNFYPVPPMSAADGIAAVALGLGRTVIEGGKCLMFCPRHPRHLVQFSSADDMLANSQTAFWALDLEPQQPRSVADLREGSFGLDVAEADGTLQMLGSTYSADNDAVYDGLGRSGTRIVSFAPVLKHNVFPLAAILDQLMHVGADALGRPVEIEFAGRLALAPDAEAEFAFLQIRPLALSREAEDVRMEDVDAHLLVCQSARVLGNGRLENLCDVVVVDFHRFERARSQEVAREVARLNAKLSESGTPYILIGVGRWGSNDPWLGIPVAWDQVSGARLIVEAGFRDMRVTPSQGSHFFQNLTAFQVGYFTVNPDTGDGFVDWQWLSMQAASEERDCVRHLHFDTPLSVVMNGKVGRGLIFKPET